MEEQQPNSDDSHTYPGTVATTTYPTGPEGLRYIDPFPERATRRMNDMERRISQLEAALSGIGQADQHDGSGEVAK